MTHLQVGLPSDFLFLFHTLDICLLLGFDRPQNQNERLQAIGPLLLVALEFDDNEVGGLFDAELCGQDVFRTESLLDVVDPLLVALQIGRVHN